MPGMKTFRTFGWLLAGALGACASGAAGTPPASGPKLPPRLAAAVADGPGGIVALYSPCGFTVVGNTGDLHFRMELTGSRVRVHHGPGSDVLGVDGLMVQVTSALADDLGPAARGLGGVQLLRSHLAWESARLAPKLGRTVTPEEIEILAADNMPSALVWWLPGGQSGADDANADSPSSNGDVPAEATAPAPERPTGFAFVTAAYGPRVLELSVQGMRGERKADLIAKAKAWMATVATSPRLLSVGRIGADIKAALAAGQVCPGRADASANAILEEPTTLAATSAEADHRLRLDGLSEQEAAQARAIAQAEGGVSRRPTPAGVEYINHVCRFGFLLPLGWQELSTKDFNGHECLLDLTTAEVQDTAQPKPVSNALVIRAIKATADLGRDALHQRLLGSIKSGNARISPVTPPLLDAALQDHYRSDQDGQSFEGDLVTLQRGEFLYQLLFTATPGSYAAGRANLVAWLGGAQWGLPR